MNILNQEVSRNDDEAHVMRKILLDKLENEEIDAQVIINCTQAIWDLGFSAGRLVGEHYAKEDSDG